MTVPVPLLFVEGLSVSYGKIQAVRDVSLIIPPGSIVTVIGTNGAGKTTTLGAIMGLLPAAKGRVLINGVDHTDSDMDVRVSQDVCLVPERRELFSSMSVEDNLLLGGFRLRSRGDIQAGIEQNYIRFPCLKERRKQLAGTLSGGERQMLAMGRALMSRPRLLMLDEPSLGLAPLIVKDIFKIIVGLRSEGVSILLVEQNARAALRVADVGYIMELGEIKRSAKASELLNDESIVELYLGGGTS